MTTLLPTGLSSLPVTTRQLPDGVDLLAAAGHDGVYWRSEGCGLAGRGVAARIPVVLSSPASVAAATEAVAALGPRVAALGALPFDRAGRGELVVPAAALRVDDGGAWLTTVGPAEGLAEVMAAEATGAAVPAALPTPPDRFELVPTLPHDRWRALVADAVEEITGGRLAKVVLARRVDVHANRPFVTSDLLERLGALYPTCMRFRVDGFVGASPELLVRRSGEAVASHPLAGTVARSGDAAADRALVDGLLASPKEREEHRLVVDALAGALRPYCRALDVPGVPAVLELRNVSHLATMITGLLAGSPSALELVAAVHPTPAVAGLPTDEAVAHLQAVEGFDRGPYAGPVGWIDGAGDGEWAIGIRSALVSGSVASLYAGVGVVAGSDPRAELAETQLKLQALLAAVVRP